MGSAMAPRRPSRGFVLFKVGPIEIAVHPSWLVIFALIVLVARSQLVPRLLPVRSGWELPLAVAIALLFYSFILIHELSHALMARAHGLDAKRITLFIFGGVAQIGAEAQGPGDEFRIALAGPLASLILAGVLSAVARTLHPHGEWPAGLWGELATINLALALFNLVPAFPLDGGRVLRAGLWGALRDRARATLWASTLGKAFAFAMIGAGGAYTAVKLAGREGTAALGLWYVVLGLFLFNVAGSAGRLEGGAEPVRPPGPAAIVGRDEGQAPQPDARRRRPRPDERSDAPGTPSDQPGDRPRHP